MTFKMGGCGESLGKENLITLTEIYLTRFSAIYLYPRLYPSFIANLRKEPRYEYVCVRGRHRAVSLQSIAIVLFGG